MHPAASQLPALLDGQIETLPALVRRAADRLASAETAAEVLEARELAGMAYDAAKRAARLATAKQAHDDVTAACLHLQADALAIEAAAKRRLADEYDAAQERGEVAGHGGARNFNVPNENVEPTAADLGLSRKQIHEARMTRDAEEADPGATGRAAHTLADEGKSPTRAAVKRVVARTVNEPRKPNGWTDERLERTRVNAKIWAQVSGALTNLTSLPRASDVAAIARAKDKGGVVNARLTRSIEWLKDFEREWNQGS